MSALSRPGAPSQRIRPLAAEDLEAVVDLSVLAWKPVFASFEAVLGGRISRRLYRPRTAQAEDVRSTCLADDVGAFVLYEAAGFTGLPLVHYSRALGTGPA